MEVVELLQLIHGVEKKIDTLSTTLAVHQGKDDYISNNVLKCEDNIKELTQDTNLKFEDLNESISELKTLVIQASNNTNEQIWKLINNCVKVIAVVILILATLAGLKAIPELAKLII